MEHCYSDLHSSRYKSKLCSNHVCPVLRCPTHEGQVSTSRTSSCSSPGYLFRHLHLLWRFHFVIGPVPKWASVGTQHSHDCARVSSCDSGVANILSTPNNSWSIDYRSLVKNYLLAAYSSRRSFFKTFPVALRGNSS